MVVVSYADTRSRTTTSIKGLTYETATAEDKARTTASWDWHDVAGSAFVLVHDPARLFVFPRLTRPDVPWRHDLALPCRPCIKSNSGSSRLPDPRGLFRVCARHRLGPEALHEDQPGLLPVGPLHPRLDYRPGLSSRPTWARRKSLAWRASGAKYGIMTSHFYWVGAIPAMVFIGIFMMPFYYGSKARSVPEYLKLRFDEKTRAFNAISFAVMTVFSSGISMHALARLLEQILGLRTTISASPSPAADRAGLHLPGRPDLGHLQRSAAVLHDRARVCRRWSSSACKNVGGWDGLVQVDSRGHQSAIRRAGLSPPAPGPNPGRTWTRPPPIQWAWNGSAWCSASGLCFRSVIGARISWWCNAPWPPIRCPPPAARR